MKKIINKEHPQWVTYWNSPIEFITPTEEINSFWFEIEDALLDWPAYKCAWLFFDAQDGQYVIAKEDCRYGTHISGGHGGEPESFDSLEEAAEATFASWFPEGRVGEYNDDCTEFTVDGQWLIREVQPCTN